MSPSGTLAFTYNSKSAACLFTIGVLPPNTKITITCTDIAGGVLVSYFLKHKIHFEKKTVS